MGGLTVASLAMGATVLAHAASAPRVACWDITGKHLSGYKAHPSTCGLRPAAGGFGHRLIGFTWSAYGSTTARGEGAAYRQWAETQVRLDRPRTQCGHRVFTRAFVRYVGYGGGDKTFLYFLKSC